MSEPVGTTASTPPGEEPDAIFAKQARDAGLVLPSHAPRDPWGALVIVVALIVLTAGIGEVTGWINLRAAPAANGNFETQTCTGAPVQAAGSLSAEIDPEFGSWLAGAGANLSQAVGGCFSVSVESSPGDGYSGTLQAPTSEFVASSAPPTPAEARDLAGPLAVVPLTLSAVAVIYNLPGVPSGLNLTGSLLAGIYSGAITSWSDSGITAINPGDDLAGLPPIAPVVLSESSDANAVFSGFLSASDPAWSSSVVSGASVTWPTGTAAESQAAMVSEVAATPGAIGYLEIFGSPPAGLGCASIEDAAGSFASPGAVDSWVAANSLSNSTAVTTGNWTGFTLYAAPAVGSYPLAVLEFAGIYKDLGVAYAGSLSLTNASWLLTYLYWLTGEASVAPLPSAFASQALNVLNNETYDGTAIVHLENENGETGESGGETGEF